MNLSTDHSEKLRLALRQIDAGSITEHQLSDLILLSRSIIQGHLTARRSKITSICLQQGLTITDLAYDCIADAFSRDADNTFYKLHRFIASIGDPLETISDLGLFLAYKSFLQRFAEAQLARLYSQLDPSGAHVHRNIREALKESRLFSLQKDYRGLTLLPREIDELEHLGPFPQEELARSFLPSIRSSDSIPRMLEALYGVVSAQCAYRRSILLLELVWLVKGLLLVDFKPELSVDHPWSMEGFSDKELQQLRADVENALKEKILLTYLVKGKITETQARGMYNALKDILEEWFAGSEPLHSLYTNLSRHLAIDPGIYEQELRVKMEYLFKIARQEVASRLVTDL